MGYSKAYLPFTKQNQKRRDRWRWGAGEKKRKGQGSQRTGERMEGGNSNKNPSDSAFHKCV